MKALAALGWICPHEVERAQLILRAEESLLRLAEAGDAEAQSMVASIWNQKDWLQLDAQGIPHPNGVNPLGRAREAQAKAAQGMRRRAAAQGNYDAHITLALLCTLDWVAGCEEDLKWLTSAALRRDSTAQGLLGSFYANGQGVAQNYQEAVKWYRRAGEQGDHHYQRMLGDLYFEGKKDVARDYAEAIMWYRRAAEATYSSSIELGFLGIGSAEKLAAIYSEGIGTLRNDAEAARWYLRAAQWGSVKSQRHLGYYYGSAHWFRRAAAQGDAVSQLELGRMFVSGIGAIQDYTQAYLWLNLAAGGDHMWDDSGDFAAKGGEAEAAKLRATLARVMTADQIAEAQALARRWTLTHEEPLPSFKLDGPCLAGIVPVR